jgi:hypothetical protein
MSNAGVGHIGFVLLFHNTGSHTCQLSGYPGAALVRSGGGQVQVPRSLNGYLGGAKSITRVQIAAGKSASALLEGDDMSSNGGTCPSYTALAVTPPNQTVTHQLSTKLAICKATIHPVVRGTSGSSA